MLQYCITVWAVTLFPELQMDRQPPSFTRVESSMVAVGHGKQESVSSHALLTLVPFQFLAYYLTPHSPRVSAA